MDIVFTSKQALHVHLDPHMKGVLTWYAFLTQNQIDQDFLNLILFDMVLKL